VLARADAVIATLEDELLAAVAPEQREQTRGALLRAMGELSALLRARAAGRRSA